MILQRDTDDLVGEDIALLDHFADIDVLDRVMVRPEGEIAARAVEVGRFQRRAEGIRIRRLAALPSAEISRLAVSNPWLA